MMHTPTQYPNEPDQEGYWNNVFIVLDKFIVYNFEGGGL